MNEIISALIIACSNLESGSSYYFMKEKQACIQRVTDCGIKVIQDNNFSGATSAIAYLNCSKVVYLK